MILNEFLQIKLGVRFEDKYNELTVKEVIANNKMYPLIAEEIINEVECAEDMGKTWNFESGFFDCDDIEFCADYAETLELYRAFVNAFSKNMKDKTFDIKYISFGLDYLMYSNKSCILDPYFHYLGINHINLFPTKTELVRKIYYPLTSKEDYFGIKSTEEYNRTFVTDNKRAFKKIVEEVKFLFKSGCMFVNCFDNKDLANHPVELENGIIGYPCDCYEICIGDNLLRFFSTERGFDAFTNLRFLILGCLDDDQHENRIVKFLKLC